MARHKPGTTELVVRINPDLKRIIKANAAVHGKSTESYVEDILTEHIERKRAE